RCRHVTGLPASSNGCSRFARLYEQGHMTTSSVSVRTDDGEIPAPRFEKLPCHSAQNVVRAETDAWTLEDLRLCAWLGELGRGAGKGGGGGGSIREAGGAFGKRQAAEEETYFKKKEKEQLAALRQHHQEEIDHHKKEIERLQQEIRRHEDRMSKLKHDG
ncbi:hypothetical protein P4O66_011442, partial [Electrophorus voltai]